MRKDNKETNKVRRRKTIPSNSQGTISRRKVTSANNNSTNNNYKKVSNKPKKRKKSNKGKIIGGFLGVVAVIGVICFALVKFDFIDLDILDGIFNKGNDLSEEVYCKEVSEENIKYDEGILYADNQLSLISKDGVKKRDIKKLAKEYDAEIVGYIEFTGDYQLELSEPKSFDELNSIVSELEADENVESASLYRVIKMNTSGGEISEDKKTVNSNDDTIADETTVSEDNEYLESYYPNDPWSTFGKTSWDKMNPKGNNWGAEAIHVTEAWALRDEMDYVKIGVLDTSVDSEHEDLKFTKVWNSENAREDSEHGTHVAGIVGAVFDNKKGISGICPKSTLYAYDIYGYNYVSLMGIKCGLAKLILNDVKVINCSFGDKELCIAGTVNHRSVEEELQNIREEYTDFLNKFISEGYDFLIVKAAGNENGYYYREIESEESRYGIEATVEQRDNFTKCENIDAENDIFSNITDEKVKSRIIVVGADVQYEDGYALSDFSNTGDRVNVLAPGENIYSTLPNDNYGASQGTSMSAPYVSGLAGMIWGINKNLTAEQVKNIIIKTANIDVRNTDKNMINARMAVNLAKKCKGEGEDSLSEKGAFLCSVVDKNAYESSEKSNLKEANSVATDNVIEDVKITIKNKGGDEIVTLNSDISGEVSTLVDPGVYDIEFEKEGYESGKLENIEIRRKDIVYKKVFMEKTSEVVGKVIDKNGNSVEGATVIFRNNDGEKTTESNNNGDFSKELKQGTYTLVVSKKGYETKEITVELNDAKENLGEITLEKEDNTKQYIGTWTACVYSDQGYYEDTTIKIKSINGNNVDMTYELKNSLADGTKGFMIEHDYEVEKAILEDNQIYFEYYTYDFNLELLEDEKIEYSAVIRFMNNKKAILTVNQYAYTTDITLDITLQKKN